MCGQIMRSVGRPQMVRILGPRLWRVLASQEGPKGFEKFWKKGGTDSKSDSKDSGSGGDSKKDDDKDSGESHGRHKEDRDKEQNKRQGQRPGDEDNGDFGGSGPGRNQLLIMLAVTGAILLAPFWMNGFSKPAAPMTKTVLLDSLKRREASQIVVTKNSQGFYNVVLKDKFGHDIGTYTTNEIDGLLKEAEKTQIDAGIQTPDLAKVEYATQSSSSSLLFPILLGLAIFLLMRRRIRNFGGFPKAPGSNVHFGPGKPTDSSNKKPGPPGSMKDMLSNVFGFGSSTAIEYGDANKVGVSFKDVAGLDGPKEEIQEFVEFLKNPEKFRKLGAKIPKGALLAGPPGTGKTLLAKACAGEAGVPFFATSGSEFVEMFVGVGAARVRDLFKKAKSKSPAIIFIDEIDAIGKSRMKISYNDERESTLNQIFVELDGFGTDTNVVVFAATNRKDALDRALIRPGRFDRIIEVSLPSLKEREDIFRVHLRPIALSPKSTKEEVAKKLAALTMGMSGADIASVCNEAALLAARYNKKVIEMDDFYEAYDRVLTGLKRKLPLSAHNKKVTAHHEAGHAIVGWFLRHAQPVLKISIVPRSKGSLGHTIMMPDEVELYRKEQIEDMICTMFGGRVAEELFMGSITTGARDDIQKATMLAKQYVGSFGMSKEFGNIAGLDYTSGFGFERKMLHSSHTAKVL